tara:strand:- start:510 stop:962 length:453 start_codon:yes stop_codon:yes gene_type:complete
MEKWTTQYDESEFLQNEIDFFKENKQEFLVSILWDEDREAESITDEEIEDHFYNDEYLWKTHREQFLYELNEEFMDYVDCEVYVEGRKMGWRNRSGYKEFTLERGEDIFYKIIPDCDLTYKIEKVKDKEYEVRIAHHDSPMGEYYNIKIK